MSADPSQKDKVIRYYDQESKIYNDIYSKDISKQEFYPANAVRFEMILDYLKASNVKTVLDVGCGAGTPLKRLLEEGFDAQGFDFSSGMVDIAKKTLQDAGHDPARCFHADLENRGSLPQTTFDAIIATGVFPHNLNDRAAYANLRDLLSDDGVAYVEFRNALMSLFSMNKFAASFYWNDLLQGDGLPDPIKSATMTFIEEKFNTAVSDIAKARSIQYHEILARFHNPLTLPDDIKAYGLLIEKFDYYHWHVSFPHLEKEHKDAFWAASLRTERSADWRGMFMCSAFVAHIKKEKA